ncbi:MAG: succinylglutamate desuccinylase/aspartoacylase family protein [Deltaproteobacteria bacterium]|nr:succinylglutamate desuccinylase/aspartoacylase family protein [Deltaproteobacteria bacterium]
MIECRQEKVLTLELPYQEQMSLERTVFVGGSGPKVAVVAGVHGDELEGLYVCRQLALWLEELAETRPQALLGRVELFPAMNPLGLDTLQRLVPVYDIDLNRNFPGNPEGIFPQRIAAAAMKALAGSALVIDIHASNIYLREIPQVRINQEFADTLVPMAQKMNLDVIWLHGAMTVLEATIAHSLNSSGVPCLVVEMGVGMRVTPAFTDQLVTGILHAWRDLGVLAADLPLPPLRHFPLLADDHNVHYLNADTSGLFIPSVQHWTTVKKGDLLGSIVSPFQGKVLSDVRSPVDALLFTLREYPLVYEGSLMARLMEVKS